MTAKLFFFVVLVALLVTGCTAPSTTSERDLAVHFAVIDNHEDGTNSFAASLTLINNDSKALPSKGWTLYFNFARKIFADSLPPTVHIEHINGDFFSLTPTDQFSLAGGTQMEVPFLGANWAIAETDAPTGFYLIEDGKEAVVVPSTVEPFVEARQTDRFDGDSVPTATPASVHGTNANLTLLPPADVPRIVPTPRSVEPGNGAPWSLTPATTIHYVENLRGEAEFLAEALGQILGQSPEVTEATDRGNLNEGDVLLAIGDVGSEEAYVLSAGGDGVGISGGGAAGVFYGVQSLLALLPVAAFSTTQESVTVDAVRVTDAPRFGYRGMHLDVSRNFHPPGSVKRLLDVMAFYKLNRFHFHLTDDEGWRLEIAGLPELVEVGGRRGHTLDEHDHIVPSYGSGPSTDNPIGSGHYTREEFIDLLRYAKERHIEVIPEIDVPGHAHAAIKAMDARHRRLKAEGRDEEAEEFLLSDPDDRSEYQSVQMWDDNVVNVCRPSTYRFLQAVVDDLVAMYAEAGATLTTVHTGGDEVPHGVWQKSPICETLVAESDEVESIDDLPMYFLRQTAKILDGHDLITAGWEEIALTSVLHGGDAPAVKEPNPEFVERKFLPYVWNNVWGWGAEDLGYKLANAGYDIVFCGATSLYFDLAYDKNPAEPGQYWAGFVDTRKAWELIPLDLFKNARYDLLGRPLSPDSFDGRARLTDTGRKHFLGIQGQLWSELAKGPERMDYLAFPKLLGLAERAWATRPAWAREDDQEAREEAWNAFANALGQRELPRLDHSFGGVAYRLPPPGAVVEDGKLQANVVFPGLAVRYTTDGTEPSAASALYEGPVDVTGEVRLRSFDRRGRGSRSVVVH